MLSLHCGLRILSCSMWDLVLWSGIELETPALGSWRLSQWTTREVLCFIHLCSLQNSLLLTAIPGHSSLEGPGARISKSLYENTSNDSWVHLKAEPETKNWVKVVCLEDDPRRDGAEWNREGRGHKRVIISMVAVGIRGSSEPEKLLPRNYRIPSRMVHLKHGSLGQHPPPFPFGWICSRLHFVYIGEGSGNPLSVLAWRIPGMGEPGGLPSMGSHRVRHDRSDVAAAAAHFVYGSSRFLWHWEMSWGRICRQSRAISSISARYIWAHMELTTTAASESRDGLTGPTERTQRVCQVPSCDFILIFGWAGSLLLLHFLQLWLVGATL